MLRVFDLTDKMAGLWDGAAVSTMQMTFLMHWSFKTGYHEIAAKKFLATGAPFPECKSWKRLHGPGSVEGWILVEADSADACYEHAAEWADTMHQTVRLSRHDLLGPFCSLDRMGVPPMSLFCSTHCLLTSFSLVCKWAS